MTTLEKNERFWGALRANEKKAEGKMRHPDGGRCCLCVALDQAVEDGYEIDTCSEFYPPASLATWYGWNSENPNLGDRSASVHNDGDDTVQGFRKKTHVEIAHLFEKHYDDYTVKG